MGDLTGRIALVTGASRGLGAATARALAAAGAKVAVTDLTAPEDLAAEIGGIARAQDVTSEADWAATMDWIKAELGGLDVLVNNAGLWLFKPILETTLDDWRREPVIRSRDRRCSRRLVLQQHQRRRATVHQGLRQGTGGSADPREFGPSRGHRYRYGPQADR